MGKIDYYDITCVSISPGDYMRYQDTEYVYSYRVLDVQGDLGSDRILRVRTISGGEDAPGSEKEIRLITGIPFIGIIIPEADFDATLDWNTIEPGKLNELILTEVELILMNMAHNNYRAPFADIVRALQIQGLVDKTPLPEAGNRRTRHPAYKRVAALLNMHQEVFQSKGGMVKLLTPGRRHDLTGFTNKFTINNGASSVRVVKRDELIKAGEAILSVLEHLMLSGLFGDIRVE